MKFLLLLILYHLVIQTTIIHAVNQYLGCFIDQIGNRDLDVFIGDYEQLIPKQCILACRAQNYRYAAIQYGDECRCGRQYGKYGQVSNEECDYPCPTAENCGGDNRNSVYDVLHSIDQLPADSSSLSERLVRADNDSTQTTNSNSIATSFTNPTSETTESSTIITSMSISSSMNSMTSTNVAISSISSSTNSISTTVQSSLMMTSSMAFSTGEITIPTSHTSTSTSELTTIIVNSTTSISVSQSSTNLVTNTMNSTESSSMYTITSSPSSSSSSLPIVTSETTTNTVTTVSNPISSQTSTIQSISSSNLIQSTGTMTSIPTSTESISTESIPISSSSITSNNPSSFSSLMTTQIASTYSSQTAETTSEQSSSISSIPNTSFLPSPSPTSNPTSVGLQTTVTSSLYADIPMQASVTTTTFTTISTVTVTTATTVTVTTATTVTTTTANTTASTVPTTGVPSSDVISTIIIVPFTQIFNPNDNTTQATIVARLTEIINLAFQCLSNPSNSNCTVERQRRKRQSCSLGYNVNLISITQLPNTSNASEYLVGYTVTNPCNQNTYITPLQVATATSALPRLLITRILGYSYDGDLVRSSNDAITTNPPNDRKLWLIGAILGPIAFTLLLIFIFCYLHYKCRPRPTNRALTKGIAKAPARTSNHEILANEPMKEPPIAGKNLHALTYADPLVRASPTPRRLTPIQTEKPPPNAMEYSVTSEVPLAEIRRQNDVERWRNKLRLQEKFQQSSAPNTTRSEPNPYDNHAYERDPSNISIQPANDIISKHSPRPTAKSTEVQVGRTKLHRLLDEVLDKADSDDLYNPDSDAERQRRRRQRRHVNSISHDSIIPPPNPEIPHIPVIPQVSERPDPSLVRLRYNPYEAGDRAHDISRLTPVELKPKYTTFNTDDQRSTQYSSHSNPPLFFAESSLIDRAATATDAYANPKRFGKGRLETDREADMRHNGGRIDQRQHKFNGDAVHIDTIPRNRDSYRVQARTVWVEPDTDNDSFEKNDFHHAKRSLTNTRNIISSIHDELRHMPHSTSSDYHA